MTWSFRVLGPLEASIDGVGVELGGAKQQMVLALLLLDANRVVSVERLVDWVWGEDATERSAGTLQVYVSNLRRLFAPVVERSGRQLISTRRPGYVVELRTDELDLLHFEALRRDGEAAAAAGRPADALVQLRAALDLWRGDPLAGLPVDAAGGSATAGLELSRVSVMDLAAESELALGRHREVLPELQQWVADHPLDERLRGRLMLALYRCGRQADALATFREGRELLVEELGIDPSRELRDLEGRILAQDPSLDLAASRGQTPALGASTAMRSSAVAPGAHLEVQGRAVPLERTVTTIGRLPDRDLVLDDAGVSRVHAEVRRTGGAHVLVDAGSANGTLVNGRRVSRHELADGDVVRLGGTVLVFRLDGMARRPDGHAQDRGT